jgi:hypothetical protein
MAGQSNMQGHGALDHLKNHLLVDDFTRGDYTQYLDGKGNYAVRSDVSIRVVHEDLKKAGPLTTGFGYSTYRGGFVGPELGFGFEVGDHFNETVLLVKVAFGGSSLAVDWRPPSAPPLPFNYTSNVCNVTTSICQPYPASYYGTRYREMLSVVNDTLGHMDQYVPNYDGKYKINGMVWWQGFNDVLDPVKAAEYKENLIALVADVRTDLRIPGLPIVVGELGMRGESNRRISHRDFRLAQRAACANFRCRFVETAKYAVIDGVKYDVEAHYYGRFDTVIKASRDFATAIIDEMANPPTLQPTKAPTSAPSRSASPSKSAAPSTAPSTSVAPSASAAPSLRPTKAPTAKLRNNFCFSGETTVQVKNKGTTMMKDLKLGDDVLSATGSYEMVYSFGHRHEAEEVEFLHFIPSNLEISREHMVIVGGHFVPASSVQIGDQLESEDGDVITVEAINTVVRIGVYAPFTASGTIVVSNIKASNYIAFQDSDRLILGGWETPLTFQWIAHTSQSPQRVSHILGLSGTEEYTLDGMSTWVAGPHELAEWLLAKNCVIIALVLVPAIGIALVSSTVEWLLSWFV